MINKFIICIILGIILYILINKIEGLTCRGPLGTFLGDPDRSARLNRLNKGSLPFFPKDNVIVSNTTSRRYITKKSQNRLYDNGTIYELKCNNMKDESGEKLAPYENLSEQEPTLTCHNPSKKVIFYNMHGSIETPDILEGTENTKIPKKMQLIFYINDGDCYALDLNITNSTIGSIFIGIYNDQDVTPLLLNSVEDNDNNLLNKGFSELEDINNIYMLTIDAINILRELKRQIPEFIVNNVSQVNIYSVTCNKAFYLDNSKPEIYKKMLKLKDINLLFLIGPYSGWFPIIDFSSNVFKLNTIIDRFSRLLQVENYVTVRRQGISGTNNVNFTYTYDMENMETLKDMIKVLIRSQSVMVPIFYLSATFQSTPSFRRLFNGTAQIELPIFCLSILSHEHFVNPFNDPIHGRYALPGGQYRAQDLINLIFDIIEQITSDDYSIDETTSNYSRVKEIYYRKMRSLGMSNDEIDTFLNECIFLYTETIIPYSISENYPLLPFMKLWEPWNYPTTGEQNHKIYQWSMQTFLLLIQLFKQDEGEAIDIHSFTCLEGIGDERTTNNAKMDYSWQYAYSDEEANNPDKRIGPECQRPVCPQSEDEINSRLVDLLKSSFIVDSGSFESGDKHPKSREITYTKNAEGISIVRDYIEPTGITVECYNNRPKVTEKLICKYDEDTETLNYDESIRQLDQTICIKNNVCGALVEVLRV